MQLSGRRRAIVQYIGPIAGKKQQTWFGCELEHPKGKNNGSVVGVQYFHCNENFGVFVGRKKIEKILLRANDPKIDRLVERSRSRERLKMEKDKKNGIGGSTFFDIEDFVKSTDKKSSRRHRKVSSPTRARSPTPRRKTNSSRSLSASKKRGPKPRQSSPRKRTPSNSLERNKESSMQQEDLARLAGKLKDLKLDIRASKKRTPTNKAGKRNDDNEGDEVHRSSIISRLPGRESLDHTQPNYENLESPAGSLTPRPGSTKVEKELIQSNLKENLLQPIPGIARTGFISPDGSGSGAGMRGMDWNAKIDWNAPKGADLNSSSWPSQMTIQEGSVADTPAHDGHPWGWNSNQVSSWLLNFEDVRQYATLFVSHDITGEELLEMRPSDLKAFGVDDEDDLDKLLQYIEHLKRFSEVDGGKSRHLGRSGSIRQLSLNHGMDSEDVVEGLDPSLSPSERFQRQYLKNIDNDFLTQENITIGANTYAVALNRLEEDDISSFLRSRECVVMAVVSESNNDVRQICLEGSRAEIVRARELLMKQGFLPRLDKEEWFDVLEETIDHGDVLEITQLLGQGMYKELNDTQLLQSATIGVDTTTKRSLALMMFLIERLPTLNLRDESGIPMVSLFCGIENQMPVPEIVRYLINESADLTVKDNEGLTPLFHATMVGHIDVVDMLLNSEDLSVNVQTQMGDTALMFATGLRADRDECMGANLQLMRHLIEKNSVNINHQNSDGVTALMVSVGFAGFGYGVQPIHTVADSEAVRLLVNAKANVNLADAKGRTALHYASESGMTDIVKVLMEADADPKVVDSAGKTPLAVANGESVVFLLAKFGT